MLHLQCGRQDHLSQHGTVLPPQPRMAPSVPFPSDPNPSCGGNACAPFSVSPSRPLCPPSSPPQGHWDQSWALCLRCHWFPPHRQQWSQRYARTAQLWGQCPDPRLRPGSSQIRTLGPSHWGTVRYTRTPHSQPGCTSCPSGSSPETCEGKPGSFQPCFSHWTARTPLQSPGQPNLVPQHRQWDRLQNRRKHAQTRSSCHSLGCYSMWGSACKGRLTAVRGWGAGKRCQPPATEPQHGEKTRAELAQSICGSQGWNS